MYTEKDLYILYRKASGKPFRVPKDFNAYFQKNRAAFLNLQWMKERLLTIWQNIDPYEYFLCGFSLYKEKFIWKKISDARILELYIRKDKIKKSNTKINKSLFIKSAIYIKSLKVGLKEYCLNVDFIVKDYLKNNICAYMLVYLMMYYIRIPSDKEQLLYYVNDSYREIAVNIKEDLSFYDKIVKEIGE